MRPDLNLRPGDAVRVTTRDGQTLAWRVLDITYTFAEGSPTAIGNKAATLRWEDLQQLVEDSQHTVTCRAPGFKVWRNRWERRRHAA